MNAAKTWNPTKQQGLYRHRSGTYYARLTVAGKPTWRTLKTAVYEIAKVEHTKLLEEVADKNEIARETTLQEHMTGADAIALREREIATDTTIKASTRKYWKEIIAYLKTSWPKFSGAEMRKITADECHAWAARIVKERSSNRYNNTVALLKNLFALAIKRGARRTSPAAEIKWVKKRYKDLSCHLPSRAKFAEWVESMRTEDSRRAAENANYAEFLAYSGMRKGEAGWVRWQNCDFERGEVLIEGDPVDSTKNSDQRRIPMIPALRALLLRMKAALPEYNPNAFVLTVKGAQRAMDRAAERVGLPHITHHELRHFFATICIESGVDIPTVSRWLGHRDGGALAMKVYGHLRNEHSLLAASRVSFAA